MNFKIAFRNLFRNRRRSLMTLGTVTIGAVATLVFGSYFVYIVLGLQTGAVRSLGHLTVFRKGYFLYGTGNPAAYGIDGYEALLKTIREDPVIRPLLAVATPFQSISGIAGNFEKDTSKTFFGNGVVPSDRDQMQLWDPYRFGVTANAPGLTDADPSRGVIGTGMGRMLGLCQALHISNCGPVEEFAPESQTPAGSGGPAPDLLTDLAMKDLPPSARSAAGQLPHVDLLAATAKGAPNVVTLSVVRTATQGAKELDDNYVGMHLKLAQQLLYGHGTPKVTGIVLQLHRTEDMDLVRRRLESLFTAGRLPLDVRDYGERNPYVMQVIGIFFFIFVFIAVIIGIVVLFTVTNTVGMAIVERTAEIGTVRALGLRRWGIRQQFLTEGFLLGLIGATAGVVIATVIVYAVNHSGLTWTPPGDSKPTEFRLDLFTKPILVIATWVLLVIVAAVSAFLPANRAARLPVVDALRHV